MSESAAPSQLLDPAGSPAEAASDRSSRAGLFPLACRLIVGGLFVVTAFAKLDEPSVFIKEIHAYGLAPFVLVNPMAFLLPWLELIAGLLLALGIWRRETAGLLAFLLTVFTIAKLTVYMQGKHIDCGCGGQIQALKYIFSNPQGIVTNLALLGLLWFGVRPSPPSRVRARDAA